ncbi:hypothetical protein YC2023_061654 [Brassica napus]
MNLRATGGLQGDFQAKRGWTSNKDRPSTLESLTTKPKSSPPATHSRTEYNTPQIRPFHRREASSNQSILGTLHRCRKNLKETYHSAPN